jgi:hypothetical protein
MGLAAAYNTLGQRTPPGFSAGAFALSRHFAVLEEDRIGYSG